MQIYDKNFCVFDDYAIRADNLPNSENDLRSVLAYNPIHHLNKLEENNEDLFNTAYLYSVDRKLIETDRAGWRYYDRIYTKYLNNYKKYNIDLLEIGIEYGYGLLAWSRYFKNAKVYGMELSDKFQPEYEVIKKNFPDESSRIKFNIGLDSTKENSWISTFCDKKFDVIIDDGAHGSKSQIKTLQNGLSYLKDISFYFIEDIKLEKCSSTDIRYYLNVLHDISQKYRLKMDIYKHVNPHRIKFLEMTHSEKIFHLTEKILKENPMYNNPTEMAIRSITKDNGNYYNYIAVFSRD